MEWSNVLFGGQEGAKTWLCYICWTWKRALKVMRQTHCDSEEVVNDDLDVEKEREVGQVQLLCSLLPMPWQVIASYAGYITQQNVRLYVAQKVLRTCCMPRSSR